MPAITSHTATHSICARWAITALCEICTVFGGPVVPEEKNTNACNQQKRERIKNLLPWEESRKVSNDNKTQTISSALNCFRVSNCSFASLQKVLDIGFSENRSRNWSTLWKHVVSKIIQLFPSLWPNCAIEYRVYCSPPTVTLVHFCSSSTEYRASSSMMRWSQLTMLAYFSISSAIT